VVRTSTRTYVVARRVEVPDGAPEGVTYYQAISGHIKASEIINELEGSPK
jgi:hypothetical protein